MWKERKKGKNKEERQMHTETERKTETKLYRCLEKHRGRCRGEKGKAKEKRF